MSGQHVSDMAMSFVEMAKAFEELPKVKAELAEANRAFNHASDTIQRLELKLIDRNTTIDELHAKIREAEVARDDAELRFLEADDKLGRVAKALAAASEVVRVAERPLDASTTSEKPSEMPLTGQSEALPSSPLSPVEAPSTGSESLQPEGGESPSISTVLHTFEPSKPEPIAPKPSLDPVEVREESHPSVVSAEGVSTEAQTANVQDVVESTSGQSDPLPTAALPIDGSTAGSTSANPSGGANSQIDDPSYANEPHDKWSVAWTKWAERMDAKFGRYNWPIRSQFATANHIS